MGTVERHPRRWLILIVLCLSTLVLVMDNMVLNVAIPALTSDLGASAQDIQWITDAYILIFAGLLLPAGSLSDRYGRRRVMLIGLVIFGLASLVATYAGDPGQLIAARALMGIGGALVMPSTLSILITVFEEDERRKAMSAWSVVAVVGLIGGPVLGGVLITHFWWGSVFLINVPVVVLAVLAALTLMPESKGPARKADPLGALLSVAGMTALVYAIIELPRLGISDPLVIGGLVGAVVCLVSFGIWETRIEQPMVPLRLFRDRNFSGGSFSLVLVQVGNGGLLLVLNQYLQFVLGYSPTEAGLAFAPMALVMIVVNGLAATLGAKIGNRALIVTGLLVVAAGSVVLASLGPDDGFGMVAVALGIFGAGAGLAQPAAITALMGAIPPEHAGVGSALNDTIQQAGAALGVAGLGSLLASGYTSAMPESAPQEARRSIADGLAVAAQTGETGLVRMAREAFTSGMAVSVLAGALGVLVSAVVAFLAVRDRKPASADRTDSGSEALPVTEPTNAAATSAAATSAAATDAAVAPK